MGEFDEMRIETGFTKGILSYILSKLIKKKLGMDVEIRIENLNATVKGEDVTANLNVIAKCKKEEINKVKELIK